jgi:pimeloyl-ACP methyl ester carboxylesterase
MVTIRASAKWMLLLVLALFAALALIRLAAWLRETDERVPAGMLRVPTSLGNVAIDARGPIAGKSILIVPGTAGWSGFWRDVSAHLASQGYRVVAVDLPPFGYSDRDPAARYSRQSQAKRLAEVVTHSLGGRAIIVAHSFGAGAATELALLYPNQVAGLVLVDGALGDLDRTPKPPPSALRHGWIAQPLVAATLTNPHAIGPLSRSMLARKEAAARWRDVLRQPMRRPGTTAAYAAWLPNLLATDDGAASHHIANLRTIKPPVHLIWGENDTVTPIAQGLRLAQIFHAPITRLPNVGHIPHIEDPMNFMKALDNAITEPAL